MHTLVGLPAPSSIGLPSPEQLAELAAADPDGVAASSGRRELTNAQLERSSTRLATALRRMGAAPGHTVVAVLEPSIESVVAMWAIRKTGAQIMMIRPGEVALAPARVGITTSTVSGALPYAANWLLIDHPALLPEFTIVTAERSSTAA